MKKQICILAGGPEKLIPDLSKCKKEGIFWIGVDRGVHRLLNLGIPPDLAVGDFDSVNEEEWEKITLKTRKIHRFLPEKDETDMELALRLAIKEKPSRIRIYGATGGRLDHYMANAFLLSKYQKEHLDIVFEIVDIQNIIRTYYPGRYTILKNVMKKYISFIPLSSEVLGLTLFGFKYPLTNRNIPFGSSLCISNELIEETGTFLFEKGILMMIRSSDL